MAKYVLVMTQDGGCDYTIGCGIEVTVLESITSEQAFIDAVNVIDYYGGLSSPKRALSSAVLYEVANEVFIDLEGIRRDRRKKALEVSEAEERKRDEAEFERLKEKLGK